MKKIKKIAVMTSGGDAPGMNAAIRSVVRACAYYSLSCVGIYRGYEGLIEGDFVELTARNVNNIINLDFHNLANWLSDLITILLKIELILLIYNFLLN